MRLLNHCAVLSKFDYSGTLKALIGAFYLPKLLGSCFCGRFHLSGFCCTQNDSGPVTCFKAICFSFVFVFLIYFLSSDSGFCEEMCVELFCL